MFCLNCFHSKTNVANSRPHKKQPSVWRRRVCPNCGAAFTTYERPALAENKPVEAARGSDTFNLGRLIISIARAFQHSPRAAKYDALWLAQTVEDLLSTESEVITPEDIAAATHYVLRNYDQLAAVQYAAQHQLLTSMRPRAGRPSLASHAPRRPRSPCQ